MFDKGEEGGEGEISLFQSYDLPPHYSFWEDTSREKDLPHRAHFARHLNLIWVLNGLSAIRWV